MCSCICLKLSQTVPTHRPTSAHVVVRARAHTQVPARASAHDSVRECGLVGAVFLNQAVDARWFDLLSPPQVKDCSSVTAASSREGREDSEQRSNNLRYQNI